MLTDPNFCTAFVAAEPLYLNYKCIIADEVGAWAWTAMCNLQRFLLLSQSVIISTLLRPWALGLLQHIPPATPQGPWNDCKKAQAESPAAALGKAILLGRVKKAQQPEQAAAAPAGKLLLGMQCRQNAGRMLKRVASAGATSHLAGSG